MPSGVCVQLGNVASTRDKGRIQIMSVEGDILDIGDKIETT